tara:strand:+ start:408 stop:950 length:543 start_codon:yes stop_codon:yes gene_type:complete
MDKKRLIRKKYYSKRKENYFEISDYFFSPLIPKIKKNKKIYISLYYPSSYEVNVLKIFENEYFKKLNFLLPIIEKNNSMNFYLWKKNDTLIVNKYGILEPIKTRKIIPSVALIPLLAFDKNKNRLGYGKGFYDRFLNKYLKINKKILTVGVAFSFQRYHNLPVNNNDFKLDYIITEKGII